MNRKTVIFDLDGTLADLSHRLHHVKNGNRRWDKFFDECDKDTPIEAMVELADAMLMAGREIVIVSGRSDIVKKKTEEWLKEHSVPYHELHMRKDKDTRPDDIVKSEILDQLLAEGHEIEFVVDDRQRVVDMWRKRGLICLQCDAWEEKKTVIPSVAAKGLLTLMIGPSGAGKSTWLENQMLPTEIHYDIRYSQIVSSDDLRGQFCGNFLDQTKNDQVFAALHAIVKTRLDHGLPAVIDATNIKRADRVKAVELAAGGKVRYIVIDRPMEEKLRDGNWRLGIPGLIEKHHNTFQSNLKDILKGDGFPNVEVIDLRKS